MKIVCSWCKKLMSEKEPFDDASETHGRCAECLKAQKNAEGIFCPKHGCGLLKKKILYGYPAPNVDSSQIILGGCCVTDDAPQFGYECPQDGKSYILDNGMLRPLWKDEETEDDDV